MKTILLFLSLLFITNPKSYSQGCLTADIMFVVDWSGSEQGNETKIIDAITMFVDNLNISENQVRAGAIIFSDNPVGIVDITGDKEQLDMSLEWLSMTKADGNTVIKESIESAGIELNNKRNVPKIMIIISDGEINDMDNAVHTMDVMKSVISLSVFAVQIGGSTFGRDNLILLTGSPLAVEFSSPTNLVESLKRLNLCN